MNDTASIRAAAERLLAAKDAENAATAARIAAESDLAHLVPVKAEGSATVTLAGFKITTTGVMNRTVDEAALDAVRGALPAAIFERAFRYKPALDLAGLRYLQQNEPTHYAVAAQAITARPGKTSVKVERVTETAQAA